MPEVVAGKQVAVPSIVWFAQVGENRLAVGKKSVTFLIASICEKNTFHHIEQLNEAKVSRKGSYIPQKIENKEQCSSFKKCATSFETVQKCGSFQ
jgi:hypothetical protein